MRWVPSPRRKKHWTCWQSCPEQGVSDGVRRKCGLLADWLFGPAARQIIPVSCRLGTLFVLEILPFPFMKKSAARPSFILAGGPKNVPLILEQSGVRYATLFTSERALKRFQLECCSLGEYQPRQMDSPTDILSELKKAQKQGCSLLLIDPPGPEINKQGATVLAVYMRQLSPESSDQPRQMSKT